MERFCKNQIKCVEDIDETLTCIAYLDSGRIFTGSFTLTTLS